MTDFDAILRALGPGAAPPLLFFILALYRRSIVLGWQYDLAIEDRNFWRDIALKGTAAAEQSVRTAEKLAQKAGGE